MLKPSCSFGVVIFGAAAVVAAGFAVALAWAAAGDAAAKRIRTVEMDRKVLRTMVCMPSPKRDIIPLAGSAFAPATSFARPRYRPLVIVLAARLQPPEGDPRREASRLV